MATLHAAQSVQRDRLGFMYKFAVLLYVLAVVLLSYRDGLTFFAKGAAVILAGLFLLRTIASGERIFLPIEYKLLLGWLLIAVVSSAISASPETALSRILTLVQVYPVAFILSNFIVWNGNSRFYWLCIVASAALSGVVTLASPGKFSDLDGRMFGTLENANAFAALLAVSIGLTLASVAWSRSIVWRILGIALAGFFVYLVARTGSRMGMLASFAAAVTVVLCFQAGRPGRLLGRAAWLVIFAGLIVAASMFFLTSSEFADRYAALQMSLESGDFRASGDMSLWGRARLYQKGFEIFLTSPLLGVGLDVFRTAQLEFRTIGNNSHSNYLEILAGTGIVGAILYFGMYYHWWSRLIKGRQLLRDPSYALFVTIAFVIATVVLVLDVAWVSYYEKLTLMVLAGLIAESSLVARARRGSRA